MSTDNKFVQAVLWPATIVKPEQAADFVSFMQEELDTRAEFIGCFETLPGDGDEGGRCDALFYVHTDDIGKFAVPRFRYGMRWVEDVIDNEKRRIRDGEQEATIYVSEVHALYSWGKAE